MNWFESSRGQLAFSRFVVSFLSPWQGGEQEARVGPFSSAQQNSPRQQTGAAPALVTVASGLAQDTVANGHFAEGVKHCWQPQQVCCFLKWLPAPLYSVTLLGYDIWRPQADGHQCLIFTFSDCKFLYFLLVFRPTSRYSTCLNRLRMSERRTVKSERSERCF